MIESRAFQNVKLQELLLSENVVMQESAGK